MPSPIWGITLEESSDFDLKVEWHDDCAVVNIDAYGAMLQVRNSPDEDPLLTATVDNGRITKLAVSGTTGQFAINIPAASIDAVKHLVEDNCFYNLVIWPSNASPAIDPKRLLQGRVKYSRAHAYPY